MDMTEGIIARFRTMHIARVSVLTGHVLGSMIQAMIAVTIVVGVALLVGFRPPRSGRLAGHGRFPGRVTFALVWLSVALGQVSGSVETASNLPCADSAALPRQRVRTTDSMPAGLRWFAEYQPFTPIIETLRGLLLAKPIGNNAWIALVWCAVVALGGYLCPSDCSTASLKPARSSATPLVAGTRRRRPGRRPRGIGDDVRSQVRGPRRVEIAGDDAPHRRRRRRPASVLRAWAPARRTQGVGPGIG